MYNLGYTPTEYNPSTASYGGQMADSAATVYNSAGQSYGFEYNSSEPEQHAAFITETFLNPERPWTPIVSNLGDVKEVVEQTFEMMTGQKFPHESIKIMICKPEDLRRIHETTGNGWSEGIMGFSFNKYGRGISEIYVKEEHLDSLLLTIGHEIGHILSPTLPNQQDEEAKAHAFSIAWMETIRDNNIAGLQPNIMLNPAQNGLHDVAYEFVKQLQNTGASAFDIFKTLSQGLTSIIAEM